MTTNLPNKGPHAAVAVRTQSEAGELLYAHWGTSKEKGTMFARIGFKILEGEAQNRIVYGDLYFTDNSYERSLQALRYCGLKSNNLLDANKEELDQTVQIVVEHEDYNGKTYARVQWVNRPGGGVVKIAAPVARDKLLAFAQQMTAKLAAIESVHGERAAKPATPPAARRIEAHPNAPGNDEFIGDDDIPF